MMVQSHMAGQISMLYPCCKKIIKNKVLNNKKIIPIKNIQIKMNKTNKTQMKMKIIH